MRSEHDTPLESSAGLISAPDEAFSETAHTEVLAFPAEHLAGLPLPVRLVLRGMGIGLPIVWTSEAAPARRDGVVFDAEELRAIAVGVQAERVWPADLKGFCLRKLQDSSFRVNELLALGGAQPVPGRPWSLGRVLRWFDLELELIELARSDPRSVTSRAVAA
jgi:hypothetical protein